MSKVSLTKIATLPNSAQLHMGGIATATLWSNVYVNEHGQTVVKVLWDNDPFAYPEPELAMDLHLRHAEDHESEHDYGKGWLYPLD